MINQLHFDLDLGNVQISKGTTGVFLHIPHGNNKDYHSIYLSQKDFEILTDMFNIFIFDYTEGSKHE